jgi:hypothetical protein
MSIANPMAVPMIFLRIGWMTRYKGLGASDSIVGGGGYVTQMGFGHEIFNFQPHKGAMYGYAQPSRAGKSWKDKPQIDIDTQGTIEIKKLGAAEGGECAEGVLAIWFAKEPDRSPYIVGWYKNAKVYRKWQAPPSASGRVHNGKKLGYFVTCRERDATLLPIDKRIFRLPPKEEGGPGQCNVWYANQPEKHHAFRRGVLNYIATGNSAHEGGHQHSADPLLRSKVEQAAVQHVANHYRRLGYEVTSVEQENLGWDLQARYGNRELKLEVKGLSGANVDVQLTPNEYKAMSDHRNDFRLCVVTRVLASPILDIFFHSSESADWETDNGKVLVVNEIHTISANCTAD